MRGDTPLRSLFDESSIIIYKEHPDFKDRIYQSRAGEDKISQRLITYLAGEIMVHYMDKRQNKLGQQSMSYDKKMFEELVGYLYQFEDALRHLEGVNLSAMQYE